MHSCSLSMSQEEFTQNILKTPSIEKSEQEALASSFFLSQQWPAKEWWTQYGSQQLNQLMETALEANPTLQAARERIEAAKQEAIIARADLLPFVSFDASDQWQYLSKNGLYRALNPEIDLSNQQIDLSFSFSYEFDFWSKYRNLYNAALSKVQMAIAEEAQATLILSSALSQNFFALQTNLMRKRYYEEIEEIRQKFFELQDKMRQNALYSLLIPLLSEEALFEAKQAVENISQEIAVNYHTINILAGLSPDSPLSLSEPLHPLAKMIAVPEKISSSLLSRRPDLMAQIWQLEALSKEVSAAKAEFFPNINLTAMAGLQSGSWTNLFEWISKTVSILPGLSLPVYTAGAIQARVDAQTAHFNEAVYQYNELILKSFQEVSDLLAIAQSVYGQKALQEQIVTNAILRYELTRLRQKSGLDSALISYQLHEEQLKKKLEDARLLYAQYVVHISLIKALGGGYDGT